MEAYKKRFNIKHFIIIIIILTIILAVVISISHFSFKKEYEPPTALENDLPRFRVVDLDNVGITGDMDNDGINDQKDILMGAKRQLEIGAKNIFLEGANEPNYYNGGDPPENLALCTDMIARAFKDAGFSIRDLVDSDIANNFSEYPLKEIWNQTVTDSNIDYRRIQNLEIFFKRNSQVIITIFNPADIDNLNQWLPGDIVFFDMDGDSYSDNVGILSDVTTRDGAPKVIYNYIDPGCTCEEDILGKEKIIGHYRYP